MTVREIIENPLRLGPIGLAVIGAFWLFGRWFRPKVDGIRMISEKGVYERRNGKWVRVGDMP